MPVNSLIAKDMQKNFSDFWHHGLGHYQKCSEVFYTAFHDNLFFEAVTMQSVYLGTYTRYINAFDCDAAILIPPRGDTVTPWRIKLRDKVRARFPRYRCGPQLRTEGSTGHFWNIRNRKKILFIASNRIYCIKCRQRRSTTQDSRQYVVSTAFKLDFTALKRAMIVNVSPSGSN